MKAFWKLLTKKEVKHLREMGICNVALFVKNRAHQIKHDSDPSNMISCWDCRQIARKTGHD